MEPVLLWVLIFFGTGALAWGNGSNDVSKGIATLIGSGLASPRRAVLWGAFWTLIGGLCSLVLAKELVTSFAAVWFPNGTPLAPTVVLCVILGAASWIFLATWRGYPVSTTHAIAGSLCAAGFWVSGSAIHWTLVNKAVLLPLLASPLLAFAAALFLLPLLRRCLTPWIHRCVCLHITQECTPASVSPSGAATQALTAFPIHAANGSASQCAALPAPFLKIGVDTLHWTSSAAVLFARGLNDGPKILAVALLVSAMNHGQIPWVLLIALSSCMGLGSLWGGRKVTQVLSRKVTHLPELEGLGASLVTATLVLGASHVGLPVSTTHVSTSAIASVGLQRGASAVSWEVLRGITGAWLVTFPASAAITACLLICCH
ncbi:MAG: inorganic phosphate transporter [Armatimonadetes bacterium]|nr:inorganic phosphate transporter [Armatimonadota bacterium]